PSPIRTATRARWRNGCNRPKQITSAIPKNLKCNFPHGANFMRLLIAGGAGYLGSVLIPKLLERGYKVDVVDLLWLGNHLPRQTGILNKDIFHLTVEDLDRYDQVIFLAGLSNDPMAEFSPSKNFIFNAAAPAYLGYMAKIAKVKRL